MYRMRKKVLFLVFLILLAGLAAAQQNQAVITYLEGTVDISRNGDYLNPSDVDIGTVLENYDLLETGPDGYVEVEVTTPVSPSVTLKVQSDTTFYYDTKELQDGKKTSFQLLAGSIGLKVHKLYNDSKLDITVNSSVMGVRGTEFNITASPDGATLVTTKEGKVSCRNEAGDEWFSTPGTVCETTGDGQYRQVAVPVGQNDAYRDKWMKMRLNILQSNLSISLQQYTELYNQYYNRFDRAWKDLEKKDDIFKKWDHFLQNGIRPTMSDAVLDKQNVSREIIELRAVLPIFQHTFYVLKELGKSYKAGYGSDISRPRKQLMDHFFNHYDETRRRLTKSLYYFRIYLEMGRRITNSDYNDEGLFDVTSGSDMLMGPPQPNLPF